MADFTSITTWRNMFTRHGSKLGWGLVLLFGIPLVLQFGLNGYQGRGQQSARESTANDVVMKVNGEDVPRLAVNLSRSGGKPGEETAQANAQAVDQAIQRTVALQMAQQRGVKADDAEVDKTLQQYREQFVGKNGTDSEWRSKVLEATGKSLNELRQDVEKQMLIPALIHAYAEDFKVTEQDAKNQNAKVNFQMVLTPVKTDKPPMMPSKTVKPLPDADAKKKAEDLLAQVKAGADIAAISKANSADFMVQPGKESGPRPEYGSGGMMGEGLGYGKDFDEAIHKTMDGQLTPVVKVTGFQTGYAFAKVIGRKLDLPPNFDVHKVMKDMKDEKGRKQFSDDLKTRVKAAKVEILDPDVKAYYAYAKLQEVKRNQQMAQFGQPSTDPVPTKAEMDTLEKNVQTEFEGLIKRNPKDATAALVLAAILKPQQYGPQGDAIRDRLQTLYETALTATEDQSIRFDLASIYVKKKMNDKALEQYSMISRLLNAKSMSDVQTAQEAQKTHTTLAAEYTSLGKPDDATKEKQKAEELTPTIIKLQAEQLAAQKKQQEEQAAAQRKQQADQAAAAKAAADKAKGTAVAPPGGASLAPANGTAVTPGGSINLTPGTPGTTPPVTVTPTPGTTPPVTVTPGGTPTPITPGKP